MTAIEFASHSQEWIAAWNAHDLERILAFYADDVELISPFVARLLPEAGGILRGKEVLREYFTRALTAYPNVRFQFIRLYSGVQSCVLEYHSVNGLRAAETMFFNGKRKIKGVWAHYCDEPASGFVE